MTTTSRTAAAGAADAHDIQPEASWPLANGAAYSPALALRVAIGLLLWLFVTHTAADPDLWGHLRFGLDMLAAGTVRLADTYSFTVDRAWVNHEWLAEALMAVSYRALGIWGLTLLKVGIIAVIGGIVFVVAAEENASPAARDVLTALAVFATYSRTSMVRPQLFSIALFCLMLYLLRRVDRGHTRAIAGVPLCFAAWVNLHGGWIVGLAVFGAWLGAALLETARRHKRTLLAAGVVTLAATFVNPYGHGMWSFLWETVGPGRKVDDWQPFLQMSPGRIAAEILLPGLALLAFADRRTRDRSRMPMRFALMLGVLVIGTLSIGRVDAFLQAAIALLLTPALLARIDVSMRALQGRWVTARVIPRWALTAVLIAGIAAGVFQMRTIVVDGEWIPDRGAAIYLREQAAGSRLLTWFDWGEYALWQLSDAGIKISMDGRRETVYSEAMFDAHYAFYLGDPRMIDLPDRIGADRIWLPAYLPVLEPLQTRGWRVEYASPRSVVLRRGATKTQRVGVQDDPRAFPWP